MKPVSVLHIITKLELGGAQKVCLTILEGLHRSGNTPLLLSGTSGTLAQQVKDSQQLPYTTLLVDTFTREVSLTGLWRELVNFWCLINTIRTLRKQHPDLIVHTHSTKAGLVGRWAAFFAGIKTRVHTVHGFGFHPYQNPLGWWINYLLELCTSLITTRYICVSSADIRTGIALLPAFARKQRLIRAAVDTTPFIAAKKNFSRAECPVATFTFGTIACFKRQKNLMDLLRAFADVHAKAPHARLEIIGDGEQRSIIEAFINNNNLRQAVVLHGWQHNVAPLMLNWNAFVLSSLWEGLPCAVVEARLLQLPVIAYNTGGISDVIQHKINGLLIRPGDRQEFARALYTVLSDASFRDRLRAHADNLHDFHAERMVQEHIALYQELKGASHASDCHRHQ